MKQEPENGLKKVLFVITKSNWGGAQRYVYDLATHLPKDGFEPVVALGGSGMLAEKLHAAGIRVIPIPGLERDLSLPKEFRAFSEIRKIIRTERPAIVHLNSSKAGALGVLAARLCGVKTIIFTAHGWAFKEDRGFVWKALIGSASWLTVILSTATIVVSKQDETIGKRMPGAGAKIRSVPLGIETPEFLPRDAAEASLSIAEQGPRIVTIAELTSNKGIAYAIDAIAELKVRGVQCSYFIIGDGELRGELARRVRDLGIAHRVRFLGFVPDAAQYLKAFDVFLLPSIKEGMPYVLLDAAAAGMPIITTTAVDPIFGQLAVEPKRPTALANAIDAMIKDPFASQEKRFPLSAMVEKTIQLYTTAPTISVSSRA